MPPSPLILQSLKFRNRLDAASEADLQRLINAYGQLAQRLQDKIDLLVQELLLNPEVTTGQVARMDRYSQLIKAVASEMQKYGNYLETELGGIAQAALNQSTIDTAALIRMAYQGVGVTGGVNKLPVNAIQTLLGFLQTDGPLYQRIQELAPKYAQAIADRILEGVGLGYNPVKVGNIISDTLGWGLTDALRWARTTQLYTYRETSRANFAANADILDGWVWFCQLDTSVPPCEACLAEHGTLHRLDETLDGHFNCRCSEIPHVRGDDNPVDQTGQDWFDAQDESVQRDIMGPGKLAAYQDGQFDFSQLMQRTENDVFGNMIGTVPLKDLVSE